MSAVLIADITSDFQVLGAALDLAMEFSGLLPFYEIAEEECGAVVAAKPFLKPVTDTNFGILAPTPILRAIYSEAVYRQHVRELLWRIERGLPLEAGTDAEVALTLYKAIRSGQLVPLAAQIAFLILCENMGQPFDVDEQYRQVGEILYRNEKAAYEIIEDVRAKLRVTQRALIGGH